LIAVVVSVAAWRGPGALFTDPERVAHHKNGAAYAAKEFETIGTLPIELEESSGVVVSRTQRGVLWSHNDSGDGPNLYAIDRSGRLLATIRIGNATEIDWEDMGSGPCPSRIRSPRCLYVADTGNNGRARSDFTVYVVAEPLLAAMRGRPSVPVAESFRFRYP